MDALILILIIIVGLPLTFIIVGIVRLFSNDELKRKSGLGFLLGGIALFGVFLLIGYSLCSNMRIM